MRLAFFAAGLPLLAAAYAATESATLQIVVVFGFIVVVLPALNRRFGANDEFTTAVQGRNPPLGVVGGSTAFAVAWAAALSFAVTEVELGPGFWLWLFMWPYVEGYRYLAERCLLRDGGAASWQPSRPLRDAAIAGLATGLCILVPTLVAGWRVGEAVATAAACAAMIYVLCVTLEWLDTRGRRSTEDAPEPLR